MKQKFFLLLIFVCAALLLLAGCQFGAAESGRAERPDATSTPSTTKPKPVSGPLIIPTGTPPPEPAALDLATLSTEEQLAQVIIPPRDLADLAVRLKPGVDQIPTVVREYSAGYAIGDQLDFWVGDLDTNEHFLITAELFYITDHVYAWLESGRDAKLDALMASIDRFSEQSYAAEVDFFGSEWSPGIDGDSRIHILHAENLGGGIAGYFSSADEYSKLANEFSNEKEMFYINLTWLNRSQDYTYYETVLAHEFQHMIHWYADRNEDTWINEGLSEFAQEIAGYDPDTIFARTFAGQPDTQLNTWNGGNQSNNVHYGSAYLFVSYFAQRFGPELTRALIAHPANGIAGVDAVLQAAGLNITFVDVFADWVVANYVDDPHALDSSGVYGYTKLEQAAPNVDQTFSEYPVDTFGTTVSNYATDYFLLKGSGDIVVEFEGQIETTLANTGGPQDNVAWWANRGDHGDSRLTRTFDFSTVASGEEITMNVDMWWEIEENYDYGYVAVNVEGDKWQILPGQRTTELNPSGNSFGAAYTHKSVEGNSDDAQWLTESFDLSQFAGRVVRLRFEYVTDDAVNLPGWYVDNVEIPAIGYQDSFEDGDGGWLSEGWLLTDNRLVQRWLLQTIELEENRLVGVQIHAVDSAGLISIPISGLNDERTVALSVSALAPVTTEPARYSLTITQ